MPFNMKNVTAYLESQGPVGTSLLKEISSGGEFHDYHELLSAGKTIMPTEFVQWYFTEREGNLALDKIQPKFRSFEVVEHYGNSWKLKVSRDTYSIGYLFGLMEDVQKECAISEYSVAQTTLEQIFNKFAMEAEAPGGRARSRSLRRSI